jgi:hypothetical protein
VDGIQLDADASDVYRPVICPDAAGGAYVFWTAVGTGTVFGQRVNSAGTAQWTAGGLGVGGAGNANYAWDSEPDGSGGACVAWEEQTLGGPETRAQRVNSVGSSLWDPAGVVVVPATPTFPELSSIVPDGGGAAYFVWVHDDGGSSDIFAQRVTATGNVSWPAGGVAVCDASGIQFSPTAGLDGSAGLMVSWVDQRNVDSDIFAQRLNTAGNPSFAADGVAVHSDPGVQRGSGVLQADDGGAIVFWHEKVNGQYDLHARKLDSNGVPVGATVTICSAAGNQFLDALIDDGAGGAIVSWTDLRNGNEDIYAQRVDLAAAPQWGADGVAVCIAGGPQASSRMISDGAGGAILAWQDERVGGNPDTYVQRLNAAGEPQWGVNGLAVCSNPSPQQGAVLASDGAGGAIVAWTDLRSFVAPAIYAQRVNSAGTAQWAANGENIATYSTPDYPDVTGAVPGLANDAIILVNRLAIDIFSGQFSSALHAQKVNSGGAEQWGPTGASVCDVGSFCSQERMLDDGAGGAYVAWSDGRDGPFDIYLQRLDATTGNGWALDGIAVCDAASWQVLGGMTRHSSGNVFLTWDDQRSGQTDVYAHHVNPSGVQIWPTNGVVVSDEARGQYFSSLAPWKNATPTRFYYTWTDNRAGDQRYVYMQRLDNTGASQWTADGVTGTELALVSTEADAEHVRLVWHAFGSVAATVYRSTTDQDWTPLGEVYSDGSGNVTFEDRDVVPGGRYGYRLGIRQGGSESFAGEAWVEVPTGLELALEGLRPNPAVRELVVSFTLSSRHSASLEMVDVSGRRVMKRNLEGLAPGRHTLRLDGPPPPAGIYFLRLTQAGRSVTARGAVLE